MELNIDLNKLSLEELKAFISMAEKIQGKVRKTDRTYKKTFKKRRGYSAKVWTENQVNLLITYIQKGWTMGEIANQFGRTRIAIRSKAYVLGYRNYGDRWYHGDKPVK